jgi:hypothetical protein
MTKILRLVLVTMLFVVALSGCSSAPKEEASGPDSASSAQATATPAPSTNEEPTQAPEPTAAEADDADEAAGEDEDETVAFEEVSALEKLDSYRLNTYMEGIWGQGEEGSVDMLVEYVSEPEARRVVLTGVDGDVMEMIRIGDTQYMKSDDTWITMQSSGGDSVLEGMGYLQDPEDYFEGEGEYLGQETVNGLETKHYHYEEQDLVLGGVTGAVTLAEADVWVSTEYDVYVKYVVKWEVDIPDEGKHSTMIEANLTDINEPITIEAPDAGETGLPDDVPMIEGATDTMSIGTMTMFTVEKAADEVMTFYMDEMQANGWQVDEEMGGVMATFTKDERTAQIMVGEEEGETSVTIVIE